MASASSAAAIRVYGEQGDENLNANSTSAEAWVAAMDSNRDILMEVKLQATHKDAQIRIQKAGHDGHHQQTQLEVQEHEGRSLTSRSEALGNREQKGVPTMEHGSVAKIAVMSDVPTSAGSCSSSKWRLRGLALLKNCGGDSGGAECVSAPLNGSIGQKFHEEHEALERQLREFERDFYRKHRRKVLCGFLSLLQAPLRTHGRFGI
jgi:hypothetical protein